MKHLRAAISALILLALAAACRDDDVIILPEEIETYRPEYNDISGFYLLNEGNMGDNKATLDYYNYRYGIYSLNIFPRVNPGEVKELGDVGNDLQIYGSKMYCVINCSKMVKVLDKNTARKIGEIEIPNCRYIAFYKGYAYVTSYVGPVALDGETVRQRGAVLKVDTTTLQILDTCYVGRQPDGLAIVNGKIYVANSGGYDVSDYERTVSVVDVASFREEERIDIAPNLHHVACDDRGILWISSRGDYYGSVPSNLYAYDTRKRRVVATLNCPVSNMWLDGDSLYTVSAEWSYLSETTMPATYKIIDTRQLTVVNECFITDGTESAITVPYGLAVNPVTKDILVTDAGTYTSPGRLYCYGRDGVLKWSVRTGDIPAHIAFISQ